MNEYDLIVIGSGPGGYTTAAEAAAMGQRVMIVERDLPGGTCLNRGCIPTKALCRTAQAAIDMASATACGVSAGSITIDYPAAVSRKDRIVQSLREEVEAALRDVVTVHGEARFTGQHTIAVDDEIYTAPKIIVATGSKPARLDIKGASLALDSDRMLEITELPQSLVIIGGGVIGMEFASIFAALGVSVTVLEYCDEILPGFDSEIAKRLRMMLKRRGIDIHTGAQVTAIEPDMSVHFVEKTHDKSVQAQTVMMAVGRTAVVPDGLRELGIELHRGFISVADDMTTSLPGIYAIGDVNGRCLLAHAATVQGRVALGLQTLPDTIPAAVFTYPEAAATGLTADRCRQLGIDVAEGKANYLGNGKALASDATQGLLKIVAERASGRIVGAHAFGAHAADLIQEITVAMSAGMTCRQLAETVHIHPTLSELIVSALINIRL